MKLSVLYSFFYYCLFRTELLRSFISFILLFVLIQKPLIGQESLGLSEGRYVSTNALFVNPALSGMSDLNWDVQLVSFHAFANTDYGQITKTNAFDFLMNIEELQLILNPNEINESNENHSVVFDQNGGDKFASGLVTLQGPSSYFPLKKDFKLGFFTELNLIGDNQNIPEGLGAYELWDDMDEIVYNLGKTQANIMAWSEIGLHLSKTFDGLGEQTSLGVNAKYLLGFESLSAQLNTDQEYYSLGDSIIGNGPGQAQLSLTNNNLVNNDMKLAVNGHGFGIDFGISTRIGEDQLGFSILDFGFIHFGSNADQYTYTLNNSSLIEQSDYLDEDEVQGVLDQINTDLLNNYQEGFKMWLPLGLSLQYDKKFSENLYVNATVVQRIPLKQNMLRRNNLLAITPRFEHKWFSIMLPTSVYNYSKFHLGMAARLGFLTFGSDNVNSLWGKRDFSGTDFYASFRIFPFSFNREVKSGCEFY